AGRFRTRCSLRIFIACKIGDQMGKFCAGQSVDDVVIGGHSYLIDLIGFEEYEPLFGFPSRGLTLRPEDVCFLIEQYAFAYLKILSAPFGSRKERVRARLALGELSGCGSQSVYVERRAWSRLWSRLRLFMTCKRAPFRRLGLFSHKRRTCVDAGFERALEPSYQHIS